MQKVIKAVVQLVELGDQVEEFLRGAGERGRRLVEHVEKLHFARDEAETHKPRLATLLGSQRILDPNRAERSSIAQPWFRSYEAKVVHL